MKGKWRCDERRTLSWSCTNTVENFLKLIDEDFFAGLIFHRVIPGFMIQGGGYTKDFKEKHCDSIKGEFKSNGVNNELKHTEGVLSMARTMIKIQHLHNSLLCINQHHI